MRTVGLDRNGSATKRLVELNPRAKDQSKKLKDGAVLNGQGLSEECKSVINEDVNGRRMDLVQAQDVLERQNQQPQGPVVQWERFLPLRSLKVLLVETDDSTRHVISLLLRNCCYEVTAVANGVEAWKVLSDPTRHVDLVLTEVVMPYFSGVDLLSKIMGHINCKSIPVIMMSTDDSMGIVFNCLSKGAVDFLVKPIRKNELKNLWQHVWRKCHSSSGSGSESGIRTQKSTKSRSVEESENDTCSNDEDGNGSVGLAAKDGSDNGSGTQSYCSKTAVEVDSSQAKSSWEQLVDPPDSTCARVIHTRPKAFENLWAPMNALKECNGENDKTDNVDMGKDLELGVPRDSDFHVEDKNKKMTRHLHNVKDTLCESKKVGDNLEKRAPKLTCEKKNDDFTEAAHPAHALRKSSNPLIDSPTSEVPNELEKATKIKENHKFPLLELSLKRPRDTGDDTACAQERNVLRHSDLSAFSRYNTGSNANQAPTGTVGSCSPLDNSLEAAKAESTQYLHSNSNPNQRSNGSSNDDMGSTTNNSFTKPKPRSENISKTIPRTTLTLHPNSSSGPQSAENNHISSQQLTTPDKVGSQIQTSIDGAAVERITNHQPVQIRHHHHHYHHHHHHLHNLPAEQIATNHDDALLRNMESNVLNAPIEGNAANYGSASGSNNRSNGDNGSSGPKGSSSAVVVEGAKMTSDNGVTGKCGPCDGTGSGSGSGVEQNRLAQREAALNKFRQKRKVRCFEKKVRYQSRKRLAEQRPRIRGQFVRQGANEKKNDTKS